MIIMAVEINAIHRGHVFAEQGGVLEGGGAGTGVSR